MKNYIKKLNILLPLFIGMFLTPMIQGADEEKKYGLIGWLIGKDGVKDVKELKDDNKVKPAVDALKKFFDKLNKAHDIYFDLEPINDSMCSAAKAAAEQRNKDKKEKKMKEINLKNNLEQLKEFVKEIWKKDVDPALSGFKDLQIKKTWQENVTPTLWWIKVAAISITFTSVVVAVYQLFIKKDVERGLSKRARSRKAPLIKSKRKRGCSR